MSCRKKLIKLCVITVLMSFALISLSAQSQGDVNNDGSVNIVDALRGIKSSFEEKSN